MLTRNVFLTIHGHNLRRQQQQLSKFLMRYQQFASRAYCGATEPVSRSRRRQRLSVYSVLRFPYLWLLCSVSFVHGLETWRVATAEGVRCACVRWVIDLLLTFDSALFFCVYPVYVRRHIILWYIVLCCAVLCCAVLCCAVLCCAVL